MFKANVFGTVVRNGEYSVNSKAMPMLENVAVCVNEKIGNREIKTYISVNMYGKKASDYTQQLVVGQYVLLEGNLTIEKRENGAPFAKLVVTYPVVVSPIKFEDRCTVDGVANLTRDSETINSAKGSYVKNGLAWSVKQGNVEKSSFCEYSHFFKNRDNGENGGAKVLPILSKGNGIYVEGYLRANTYKNANNEERTTMVIDVDNFKITQFRDSANAKQGSNRPKEVDNTIPAPKSEASNDGINPLDDTRMRKKGNGVIQGELPNITVDDIKEDDIPF
mgnify:CR=1 FL=1|jgi:single-stranded DNA-binding protein